MKNAIKRKTWLLLVFLTCLVTSAVQAGKKEVLQGRILTGVVLDEQGLPAIGAKSWLRAPLLVLLRTWMENTESKSRRGTGPLYSPMSATGLRKSSIKDKHP